MAQYNNGQLPGPQYTINGHIVGVVQNSLVAQIPPLVTGAICTIECGERGKQRAKVLGFRGQETILCPFETFDGISTGAKVSSENAPLQLQIPKNPRGCVLDAMGNILHATKDIQPHEFTDITVAATRKNPLRQRPINEQIETGVKSIDCLIPLGKGQRLGIFAPPGSGKSTLMSMFSDCQGTTPVICLVGERSREIHEFVFDTLGEERLQNAVVVATASDSPPMHRYYAAYTATTIAERLASQHNSVLLLIDSLTRVARAMREVFLSAGELPVRQGYTPSVFSELPKLLERAGRKEIGSITGVYTVLTSDGVSTDSITDEIRSLLDGHIVLSNDLARRGIYPAISALDSLSRLEHSLLSKNEYEAKVEFCRILDTLRREGDAVQLGAPPSAAYQSAKALQPFIEDFLSQNIATKVRRSDSQKLLSNLVAQQAVG